MVDNPALWRLIYVLPNLLAGFGMGCVAFMIWRRRQSRGGMALWTVCASSACWAFGEGLCFIGLPQQGILLAWKLAYIGVCVAPLALMMFALDYVGYTHLLNRRRIVLLMLLPVATFVAAWTNEWHGLIWAQLWMDETTPIPTLANHQGPLLWVYFAYCNLLAILTTLFLWRRMPSLQAPQRRQIQLVLLALFVPLLANILYMGRLMPLRNMDPTPLAFNVTVLMFVRSIVLERLFDLIPVSAHEIYRSLDDSVFVVDDKGRLLDLNESARQLLPSSSVDQIGQLLRVLLPEATVLLEASGGEARGEVRLGDQHFDVHSSELHSVNQHYVGRLLVWRDITERKRFEAELQQLAITDSLTGLGNRRHFFERGEMEIVRARRYERPLSLIMIDIDRFKSINDSYGHEAGDRVLVALARLLNAAIRSADCVARLGGEEFALLLPETEATAANEVAERLLGTVRAERIVVHTGTEIEFTISAGVVALEAGESALTEFLRRADDALYRAKNTGRDQAAF